ncbi:hypothetical protein [Acinetobacter suaedae]|uniref:hypothetical protein n=1 Tax=Acinetobacter suaedae TaxID=2609668 RepID=UPI00148EFE59|nr:hypothetical protein [Acinetobacter sp. C16S1]
MLNLKKITLAAVFFIVTAPTFAASDCCKEMVNKKDCCEKMKCCKEKVDTAEEHKNHNH